jgi:putative tricarboxylic transport membrane protein
MNLKKIALYCLLILGSTLFLAACNSTSSSKSSESADNDASAEWPKKDIKLVVHSGPGNLDTALRQAAKGLEDELGVNVIVENHPGGAGAVAATVVQGDEADGYTFLSMTGSTSFNVASGQNKVLTKDWPMVASLQKELPAIAVLKDSPLKTVDDLVEAMKNDSSELVVGGYGSAGFMTYVYYKLQQQADFKGTWIPIDTTDEVATGLLGGHIDVAVMTPSTALSSVKNGDVRLLAIAGDERSPNYPDVPTFKEQGYEINEVLWRGLAAKEGTPKEIVDKMHEALMKVSETDEWVKFQEQTNQENDPITPEQVDERFANEISDRTQFLKDMDLME